MKLYRFLLMLIIPTLIILQACGGDSSSSSSSPPPPTNEEESNAASTGGSTGGDGGNTCMTSSQKNNIRTLMDRFAGVSPVNGHATDVTRNPDGTFTTIAYPDSVITVTKTATDTWKMSGMFCEGDMCISRDIIHSVAGTCYTQDTRVTHINSASSTRLSTRITDNTGDPIIERSVISVPTNGRVNFNVTITNNGLMTNTLTFTEDLTGGSTGGSTGASSAASTASSTAASTTGM